MEKLSVKTKEGSILISFDFLKKTCNYSSIVILWEGTSFLFIAYDSRVEFLGGAKAYITEDVPRWILGLTKNELTYPNVLTRVTTGTTNPCKRWFVGCPLYIIQVQQTSCLPNW